MNKFSKGIIKYRNYILVFFIVIIFLYNQPNIWSLIGGFLLIVIGELIRLNAIKHFSSSNEKNEKIFTNKIKKKFLGTIIIYFGLSFMSFALFPYLQIIVLIYFSYQFHLMFKEIKLEKESYSEENFLSNISNKTIGIKKDKRTIQAELFFTITFFLLWYLRRLS